MANYVEIIAYLVSLNASDSVNFSLKPIRVYLTLSYITGEADDCFSDDIIDGIHANCVVVGTT